MKVIDLICDAANIFKSAVEYICANTVINVSEINDVKMALEEIADQLCEDVFAVGKESSYEDVADFFEELTTRFCEYVDASGVVIIPKGQT